MADRVVDRCDRVFRVGGLLLRRHHERVVARVIPKKAQRQKSRHRGRDRVACLPRRCGGHDRRRPDRIAVNCRAAHERARRFC